MEDAVLERADADRMVVGHTPQAQINTALQDKIWRVDVGMSKGMDGGDPEVLEIVKGENGEEEVSILTESGRVPSSHRRAVHIKSSFD